MSETHKLTSSLCRRAFAFHLKHCRNTLLDVFANHFVAPEDDSLNFGVKLRMDRIGDCVFYLPADNIISGVREEGIISIMKGKIHLEAFAIRAPRPPPTLETYRAIYDYQTRNHFDSTEDSINATRTLYSRHLMTIPAEIDTATLRFLAQPIMYWMGGAKHSIAEAEMDRLEHDEEAGPPYRHFNIKERVERMGSVYAFIKDDVKPEEIAGWVEREIVKRLDEAERRQREEEATAAGPSLLSLPVNAVTGEGANGDREEEDSVMAAVNTATGEGANGDREGSAMTEGTIVSEVSSLTSDTMTAGTTVTESETESEGVESRVQVRDEYAYLVLNSIDPFADDDQSQSYQDASMNDE